MEEFNGVGVTRGPETIYFVSLLSALPWNNFQLFYVFRIDGLPRVLQQHQRDRYGEGADGKRWRGVEKEEVAETKALYTVFRTRTKSSPKGKTIRKERKIVEHAIFHLVTRPIHFTEYSRTFLSGRCRSTTGRGRESRPDADLQTRVAKDIIAARESWSLLFFGK